MAGHAARLAAMSSAALGDEGPPEGQIGRARACRNERDDDRSIGKSRHEGISFGADAKIHPAQKRGWPGEVPAVASVRDQTLVWRVAASSSGST
jgi:hypothetical protein